jgi:Co/Zn/Cd efflux system component
MAGCCHGDHCSSAAQPELNSPRWRRALWIALAINATMFAAEIAAGVAAGSVALQADALDFLGDAANYAISLAVAGMALQWRAKASLLKGATLGLFGLWVLGNTAWHAYLGTLPRAEFMGIVGLVALIVNGGVALMLYRFRTGDANMRSVIIVATIMAALGISGGWQIVRQAVGELHASPALIRPVRLSGTEK